MVLKSRHTKTPFSAVICSGELQKLYESYKPVSEFSCRKSTPIRGTFSLWFAVLNFFLHANNYSLSVSFGTAAKRMSL